MLCWSVPREAAPLQAIPPAGSVPARRQPGDRAGWTCPGDAVRHAGRPLAAGHLRPGTTERTTLLVPDESARRAWLGLLVRTSRSLAGRRAAAGHRGRETRRPAHLVAPARRGPARPPVCTPGSRSWAGTGRRCARPAAVGRPPRPIAETETGSEPPWRIASSSTTCGATSPRLRPTSTPSSRGSPPASDRLALLSLQAQVLWGRGETDRAREVAELPARGGRRACPSRRGDADRPVARAGTRLGPAVGPLPRDPGQPDALPGRPSRLAAAGRPGLRSPVRGARTGRDPRCTESPRRCRAVPRPDPTPRGRRPGRPGTPAQAVADGRRNHPGEARPDRTTSRA